MQRLDSNEQEEAQEYLNVLSEDDVEDYDLTRFIGDDEEWTLHIQ